MRRPRFREKSYRGKIEIKGRINKASPPGGYENVQVKLDGKIIPRVQMVDVHFNLEKVPFVLLKIMPEELDIDIENVEITERRKEMNGDG